MTLFQLRGMIMIYTMDRTDWGSGPWDAEPDQVEWRDPVTNLVCLLRRNFTGAWCGYVGLPSDHPLHNQSAFDLPPITVHGGVTYAGPVGARDLWFIGFDCVHSGDNAPNQNFQFGTYRDIAYVTAETVNLAMQAKRVFVNALKSSVHGA